MLLLLKNKKIQILLLSLTCTNIIFFLNKNTDNSIHFYSDINFRNLPYSQKQRSKKFYDYFDVIWSELDENKKEF